MSGLNFTSILWDRDDDPRGNVQHIARHNLTMEEVEAVFQNPGGTDISRSSGRPVVFGDTGTGRYIMVAYDVIDSTTAYPITAYEVRRPKRKRS
ncbi:MAG: BrnT family toxin [Chthoniobacterales bacterium]|nr:BrnT family toxin [Chthoniobacterales bacterium]